MGCDSSILVVDNDSCEQHIPLGCVCICHLKPKATECDYEHDTLEKNCQDQKFLIAFAIAFGVYTLFLCLWLIYRCCYKPYDAVQQPSKCIVMNMLCLGMVLGAFFLVSLILSNGQAGDCFHDPINNMVEKLFYIIPALLWFLCCLCTTCFCQDKTNPEEYYQLNDDDFDFRELPPSPISAKSMV